MSDELEALANLVGGALARAGWKLTVAESCTGGWICQVVTSVPGSSAWFDCGWVTYSNAAKSQLLGVDPQLIVEHGAVSEPVVRAMTAGALARSGGDIAVAVSGVAGPDGGSTAKPIGTVWLAWQVRGDDSQALLSHFGGNRTDVRRQAVVTGLKGVLDRIGQSGTRARQNGIFNA